VASFLAHHQTQWADGGPADLANGSLLCESHHHQVHRQGWQVTLAPHGYPALIPPASIDPPPTPTPTTPPVPHPHRHPTPTHLSPSSNQVSVRSLLAGARGAGVVGLDAT